jgi:hypothetical protein
MSTLQPGSVVLRTQGAGVHPIPGLNAIGHVVKIAAQESYANILIPARAWVQFPEGSAWVPLADLTPLCHT